MSYRSWLFIAGFLLFCLSPFYLLSFFGKALMVVAMVMTLGALWNRFSCA